MPDRLDASCDIDPFDDPSTVSRSSCAIRPTRLTRHRVAAALMHCSSRVGRASNASERPSCAASCSRRLCAISSPLPSATTTAKAGQRIARSMAQIRSSP
ncbi:MAG: hypothetical protein ACYTGC_06425, partial [Planctomycetota bacterium]